MSNYFVFDSIDTRDYGIDIFYDSVDDAPVRQYKTFTANGRNGVLVLDLKRYDNIDHSYDAIFRPTGNETALHKYQSFRDALYALQGYKTLYDSFNDGEHYKAYVSKLLKATLTQQRDLVRAQIVFSRKPERYVVDGDAVFELTADGTITNPTSYESRPMLRIYGAGTTYIGSQAIVISSADIYTDIDCDAMLCYKGTANKGTLVSFSNNAFPTLKAGTNTITLGTGITKVEITPRWYTL